MMSGAQANSMVRQIEEVGLPFKGSKLINETKPEQTPQLEAGNRVIPFKEDCSSFDILCAENVQLMNTCLRSTTSECLLPARQSALLQHRQCLKGEGSQHCPPLLGCRDGQDLGGKENGSYFWPGLCHHERR